MGPVSVLQWAIYTDTADYSEWKTGRRATALIMAASLFALKLGVAFGGAALGWILDAYGYAADTALDAVAIKGICLSMSVYAAIPALAAGAVMLFYPLSNKKMSVIEADLMERRGKNRIIAKKESFL
jgi:GPH family glycoside/pentoside/hexuronide:cation symporter